MPLGAKMINFHFTATTKETSLLVSDETSSIWFDKGKLYAWKVSYLMALSILLMLEIDNGNYIRFTYAQFISLSNDGVFQPSISCQ